MTETAVRTVAAPAQALVARDRELAELGALLEHARLVTLTGPAGVGKSRLARALADDGRWRATATADLTDVRHAEAAARLLHSAAAGLAAAAGPRLLVLDNCDLALGPVARFAADPRDEIPGLRILATSRECLGTGPETVYPVPPLAPADAEAYFAARVAAHRAGVPPEITAEWREACARLDGLPLALELAAAQTTVLTSAQLVERLDDAMRVLVRGARTGPAHHRSLRGAFDWAAATLTPGEGLLLRRLSVFAAPFTLEPAERICAGAGLGEEEVLEALAGLVAKSLVVCDPSGTRARYRLMRTVRQYAAGLLARSPDGEPVQRARAAYAARHPERLGAADLAAALAWCADRTAPEGLRLAVAAAPYLLHAGRIREGARLLNALLTRAQGPAAAPSPGPPQPLAALSGPGSPPHAPAPRAADAAPAPRAAGAGTAGPAESAEAGARPGAAPRAGIFTALDFARARLAAAMFDCALGRADEALRTALDAGADCVRLGDPEGGLWAEALAGAALLAGDPQAGAERTARAAGPLAAGSAWGAAAGALHAAVAAEAGHPAQARAAAESALAAARRDGRAPVLAAALLAAATVARRAGRFTAARAALDEAEALTAGRDAVGTRALLRAEGCRLALDQGRDADEEARHGFEQAIALATEADSPLLLASALDAAGRSRLAQGRGGEARAAFARLTALSRGTGSAQAAAGILGLGEVALAAGSAGAAWALIEEAHALARAGAPAGLLARTLQGVGDCARALGDASRAWSAYHQALGVRLGAGLAAEAVESLEALAGLGLDQERTEYGVRLLGAAQALRDAQGSRRHGPAQERHDAARAVAAAALTAERCAELYAAGGRLSLAEAAEFAGRQRRPRRRGTGWVSLTPAERRVADLAAAGLTNREIGERLFSSPRTVQAHLSHVFAKLGVASRRALAAEAEARDRHLPGRDGDA